jgi:hypothetical protein
MPSGKGIGGLEEEEEEGRHRITSGRGIGGGLRRKTVPVLGRYECEGRSEDEPLRCERGAVWGVFCGAC